MFEKVIAEENLYAAAHRAARGKRFITHIARWRYKLEERIMNLREELISQTYRPGRYRCFTIYEPKKREIAAAPFRDRVVHQAMHAIIEPVLDKRFMAQSFACRKAKGTHKALDAAQKLCRARSYVFHGDICKFFPSINHEVLKKLLRRGLQDRRLLGLCDLIIDSANSIEGQRGYGLPIGNLTSQLWANVYLHELDHFVKHHLRCRGYLRYMDDFLMFADDKRQLHAWKARVRDFLRRNLKLSLNQGKSQVYRCRQGITFLGFRLWPDYRRLGRVATRRAYQRMACHQKAMALGRMTPAALRDSWQAWQAHVAHGQCRGLEMKILRGNFRKQPNAKRTYLTRMR